MLAQIIFPQHDPYMLGFFTKELPRYQNILRQNAKLWIKKKNLYCQFDVKNKVEILVALEFLTQLDEVYLIYHPTTKPLYKSGVQYIVEAAGKEEWLTIPVLYQRGFGDCEDLACALTAERRVKGFPCDPWLTKQGRVWHVQSICNDIIEDPSAVLGMGNP